MKRAFIHLVGLVILALVAGPAGAWSRARTGTGHRLAYSWVAIAHPYRRRGRQPDANRRWGRDRNRPLRRDGVASGGIESDDL